MYKANLSKQGVVVFRADNPRLSNQRLNQIIKQLTITYEQIVSRNLKIKKLTKVYKFVDGGIVIPRAFAIDHGFSVENSLTIRQTEPTHESKLVLDNNQQAVHNYLKEYVFSIDRVIKGTAVCVLQMDTGLGKTYVGISLIQGKTIITAPRKAILKGWRDALVKYTTLRIATIVGSDPMPSDVDVVLVTAKSLYNKPLEFYDVDLLIIDEIHLYTSEQYRNIFWNGVPIVLGLTATPDLRVDGLDGVFKYHLGEPLRAEQVPGFNPLSVVFTGRVHAVKYYGPKEYTKRLVEESTGATSIQKMLKQIESNPARTNMIMSQVSSMFTGGMNAYVFAENVEYLRYLRDLFVHANPTAADYTFLLIGGVKDDYLEACKQAKMIFTTYGYSTEGISYPQMDSILFATPRKNKSEQIVGRVLRRDGDTSVIRNIVDVIDCGTVFQKQFYTRSRFYEKKSYEITSIVVK